MPPVPQMRPRTAMPCSLAMFFFSLLPIVYSDIVRTWRYHFVFASSGLHRALKLDAAQVIEAIKPITVV